MVHGANWIIDQSRLYSCSLTSHRRLVFDSSPMLPRLRPKCLGRALLGRVLIEVACLRLSIHTTLDISLLFISILYVGSAWSLGLAPFIHILELGPENLALDVDVAKIKVKAYKTTMKENVKCKR